MHFVGKDDQKVRLFEELRLSQFHMIDKFPLFCLYMNTLDNNGSTFGVQN